MYSSNQCTGVLPATVLPLDSDYSIDEVELRRIIRFLSKVPGIAGLLCNGHAADCWSISREERRRLIAIHVEEGEGRLPIVAAVSGESTKETISQMEDAKNSGASAVLVMPPGIFRNISLQGPEIPLAFFRDLANAVDIPIIVFQHPVFRGNHYSPETLAGLTEIENIIAVKETVWDLKLYERDLVALRKAPRHISTLLANDTILFPCLALGDTDGLMIGLATLAPHWAVELLDAMKGNHFLKARQINDRFFPITEMLYYTLGLNTYSAMKETVYMLGVLKRPSFSRSPVRLLTDKDRDSIRIALEKSGLRSFYEERGLTGGSKP